MIAHKDLGTLPFSRSRKLLKLLQLGAVTLGGNKRLKIYGTLQCSSGKRMKTENRVFFKDEYDAVIHGYRPCGNCLKNDYRKWKDKHEQTT